MKANRAKIRTDLLTRESRSKVKEKIRKIKCYSLLTSSFPSQLSSRQLSLQQQLLL